MIDSWIFEFFPELGQSSPDVQRDFRQYFSDYMDLWAAAEARGFKGIFFSEHHYGGSFSPSPNLLIAALARRTTTIRLGVMGVVTPLYAPFRIVEEIGMLDQLTGGRLEIGTASGVPQELSRVNMSLDEARERNEEAVRFLDAALTGEPVTFQGKYFSCDRLTLSPRPLQCPAPPKWTTVISANSARNAAKRKAKICTAFHPTTRVKEIFDAFREEAEQQGNRVGSSDLALRRRVAIAESPIEAEEMKARLRDRIREMLSQDYRAVIDPITQKLNLQNAIPDVASGFVLGEDEFISGTPDAVCEQIVAQCQHVGASNFLAVLHWGAPFDEVSRAHALFGRKVVPKLKNAFV